MSVKHTQMRKMNDLSGKSSHKYANGYMSNVRHTAAHRSTVGIKSGHVHVKNGLKYGTTKSLPVHRGSRHSSWQSAGTTGTSGYSSGGGHNRNQKVATSHRSGTHGYLHEKKEKAIAFFDIELEKPESYIHRPGEEVKGYIHMDITKNVEICFLDLLVMGQGLVSVRRSKHSLPKTQKEVYLNKRKCVIGTSDARWSSVLTPGHYISNFKIKLPNDIPSSLSFTDPENGVTFDIGYVIKARICDDTGTSSVRSLASMNNAVKVLLSKKYNITVQRAFDIHLIPNSLNPVAHEEEIVLSCGNNSIAHFTLELDRAVFLAGDDIRLQLSSQLPATQSIKQMTCKLQQNFHLRELGDISTFTLSDLSRHHPHDGQTRDGDFITISMDVTLPTQTHLVPSFLAGCKTIRVTYTLDVTVKLQPAGGKVTFSIPIAIGPCAEPIYAEKSATRKSVPVFNRPVRFPCFSPSQQNKSSLARTERSKSLQSINVVTTYSNSAMSRCFLCCFTGSSIVE